jgi:tRNA-dihydrouridine synthase
MREPEHAASVIAAMTRKVRIPVTVKMRAGWNDEQRNAGVLARLVQDAGASAIAVHGRTAAQSYSGSSDWTSSLAWPNRWTSPCSAAAT